MRAEWFAHRLLESADAGGARAYLEKRDIALEVAAPHGLGYAPSGGAFMDAMRGLGIKDQVLVESGLAVQREDGRVHARFRDRLLFPIHDIRGRAVGFGGRLLGPGEPKYLNSPETPIFHKGRQLYNLHHAKQAIRQEQVVIVVEGYFDVLRLVLAGIDHVVAPLGTALTPEQAALLKRVAPAAILLYDSDSAGLRATFRAGRRTPAARRPGARCYAAAGRGPRYHRAEGWRRRARADPARRHRRARAEDPRTRPARLVPGCGASPRGARQAAADRARGHRPDHARALPGPRGGAVRGEPRGARARTAVGAGARGRRAARGGAAARGAAAPPEAGQSRASVPCCDSCWRIPTWWRARAPRCSSSGCAIPLVIEVFSALLEGTPVSELFQRISPDAASLTQELLNAEDTAGLDADATYAEALLDLEARPLLAAYHALRGSRADDEAGAEALESRRLVLKRELAAKYPKQWKQYIMRTRTTGRPGPRPPRRSNAP